MANNTSKPSDYVIGLTGSDPTSTNSNARQSATIESLVLSELLSIWQNDELDLETVLDRIETMEHVGWEHTLRWLGYFYSWDSVGDEWQMSLEDQEVSTVEAAKEFVKSETNSGK